MGLPLALVSVPRSTTNLPPFIVLLGLLLLFMAWGLALVPVYQRLTRSQSTTPPPQLPEEHVRAVQTIDRRQFLIRIGAATATIRATARATSGNDTLDTVRPR